MTVKSMIEHPAKRRKKVIVDNKDMPKCQYVNPKNHRKCGLQVRKGMKYCFAHISIMEHDANAESKIFRINKKGEKVGRIPCPLDPRHTIWADKLRSHLGKCNAVRKKREIKYKQDNCAWFDEDINVKGEKLGGDMKLRDERIDYDDFKQFIDHSLIKYHEYFNNKPELKLDQKKYKEGLEERFGELENKKHLTQQSSLIGQLVKYDLFSKKSLYVEFGCGRSELSRYLNRALYDHDFKDPTEDEYGTRFLMVDRDSPRLKMDKKIVEDVEHFGKGKWLKPEVHRLKVDIKDLVLANSMEDFVKKDKTTKVSNYIGISKHLCGVATDLTLRCLVNSIQDEKSKGTKQDFKFKGFLVAMCCRHCCYYPWLLKESKEFLKKNFDIDESNFKYLRKMCPWATSGCNCSCKSDGHEHFSGMSLEEREKVGLKMRRILDTSRCYAMEQKGFHVHLVNYVPRDVTLENNCMVITL